MSSAWHEVVKTMKRAAGRSQVGMPSHGRPPSAGAQRGFVTLSSDGLALLACLWWAVGCNRVFWAAAMGNRAWGDASTWVWVACLGVAMVALHFVLIAPFMSRWTAKPVLALLAVATAFAVYFVQRYSVYLDPSMLRNTLRTNPAEAGELFNASLGWHLLWAAGLPLAALWAVRIRQRSLWASAWRRVMHIVLALGLATLAVMLVFQDLASMMRNHREMRFLITPGNYIYSLLRVASEDTASAAKPKQAIGLDAKRTVAVGGRARVVVMVVGETARAANWGLNGYARQTTPQLAAMPDVIGFAPSGSCGTNTEVSVPCMFSPGGRRHYDEATIRGSESLLHVVQRAGVAVHWRDNQSGCKGVCDGLSVEDLSGGTDPALCAGGQCWDEVLLKGLAEHIRATPGSQLMVLHQLGNHGPAYFKRYPPAFKRFTPACEQSDLRLCSKEDITNAYDNALLYTDHVLAQLITTLRGLEATHDVAMVYMSDHGESLGENNLFLHGLPYAIAPQTQTQVPLVMWFSTGFAQSAQLDVACLRTRAKQAAHPPPLSPPLLALTGVGTALYEPAMDLTATCRK